MLRLFFSFALMMIRAITFFCLFVLHASFSQSKLENEVYELQRKYPADPAVVLDSLSARVKYMYEVKKDTVEAARTLSAISFLLNATLNNSEGALDYRDRLDSLYSVTRKDKIKVLLLELDAKIALLTRDSEIGLDYYLEALTISKELDYRRPQMVAGVAGALAEHEKYDTAIWYFRQAEREFINSNSPEELGLLYHNLAVTFFFDDQLDSARKYLGRAIEASEISGDNIDRSKNLYSLANFYIRSYIDYKDDAYLDSASVLLSDVLDSVHLVYAFESKALIYRTARFIEEEKGNYKKALEFSKIHADYLDSSSLVDLKAESIRQDFQSVKLALENQQVVSKQQLAESKRKRDLFILVGALILIVTLALAAFFVLRSRFKNKVQILEAAQLKREKQMSEQLLTTKSMAVLAKDKVVLAALDKLNTYFKTQDDIDPLLKELRAELKISLSNETWEEIEDTFNKAHPDFIKKLYSLHPDITKNERRLCVLIYLNLSSKEIGDLTGQSISTINVARSRLRKKLGLKDQSVSVYSHLQALISVN